MTDLDKALHDLQVFILEFNSHMHNNLARDMETKKQLAEVKRSLLKLLEERNAGNKNGN